MLGCARILLLGCASWVVLVYECWLVVPARLCHYVLVKGCPMEAADSAPAGLHALLSLLA